MNNPPAVRVVFSLALLLPTLSFAATPVNINRADAATIADSLDGVGAARARDIVTWRDAHGPFKTVDELAQVKGIGESTLTRNRAVILLADAAPAAAASPLGAAPPVIKSEAPVKKAKAVRKAAQADAQE